VSIGLHHYSRKSSGASNSLGTNISANNICAVGGSASCDSVLQDSVYRVIELKVLLERFVRRDDLLGGKMRLGRLKIKGKFSLPKRRQRDRSSGCTDRILNKKDSSRKFTDFLLLIIWRYVKVNNGERKNFMCGNLSFFQLLPRKKTELIRHMNIILQSFFFPVQRFSYFLPMMQETPKLPPEDFFSHF